MTIETGPVTRRDRFKRARAWFKGINPTTSRLSGIFFSGQMTNRAVVVGLCPIVARGLE